MRLPQTRGETYHIKWGLLCTTANNPLEMTLGVNHVALAALA
jgi:hypothetical protein